MPRIITPRQLPPTAHPIETSDTPLPLPLLLLLLLLLSAAVDGILVGELVYDGAAEGCVVARRFVVGVVVGDKVACAVGSVVGSVDMGGAVVGVMVGTELSNTEGTTVGA